MTYFPGSVIPGGLLKPETYAEVDGSPAIYNARLWNAHHRELIAIEKSLLGKQVFGAASGVSGFSCANFNGTNTCPNASGTTGGGGTTTNIAQAVQQVQALIQQISNGGLFGSHCGTVAAGNSVPIPPDLLVTVCQAPLLATATSIPVASTAGFPSKGFITKFNNDPSRIECQVSGTPPVAGRCNVGDIQVMNLYGLVPTVPPYHATNQEFIKYSSLTPTSFEGCVRGYGGTTAQDLVDNGYFATQALVANGRATIFLTQNFWRSSLANIEQVLLSHDSMLKVTGSCFRRGRRAASGRPKALRQAWLRQRIT